MSNEINDPKQQLIEKLLQLPNLQGFDARTVLLENVPGRNLVSRVEANAQQDLRNIFDFAEIVGQTANGHLAIEIVFKNALRPIPSDTQIYTEVEYLMTRIAGPRAQSKSWPDDEIPFVNRQDELNNILSDMAPPYHVIEAPAGYGKSKIMGALRKRFQEPEKNYLCGFAGGLNQGSFINIIRELCANLGLPPDGIPLVSNLPSDLEKRLQIAQDLGHAHAGLLLGKHFNSPTRNYVYTGVVILLDDLDRLIKKNDILHSSLMEQIKVEIRLLVSGYIRAMQEVFSMREPFRGQNRFRVVISLRYGSEYSDLINYLPFAEIALKPFEYRVVSETVARVLTAFDRSDLDQISAHLLHLTGGHPDCIIELIQNYKDYPKRPDWFEKTSHAREIWEKVVEPRVQEIKDSIPDDLQPIFQYLSFYRTFNTAILDQLIHRKELITAYDRHMLADRLTLTYLYQRRGQLLSDSITRRLFAIERRQLLTAEDFRKCCNTAYELSLSQLDDVQRQNTDEWALECFYQFLQGAINEVQQPEARYAIGNKFKREIIPEIMTAYSKHSRDFEADRSLLLQKIGKDWELLFTINYFLRDKEFNNEPVPAFLEFIKSWKLESSQEAGHGN